ncbi:MAG: ATP-binding cassette domain-containing protein [Micromonosporaceae bacterium]|nr:ATP-binding cassette domain-containing protein [Micromonosporaceae bacterium]
MNRKALNPPGEATTLVSSGAGGSSSQSPDAEIEFVNVEKYFLRDGRLVETLRDLNLAVPRGQFVCLIGPSGCGKSTLLNMTAGLFEPTAGSVRFQGSPVALPNTKVGYITQQDNLLPWRTTARNVELALRIKKMPKAQRRRRAQDIIDLVGLSGFEDAYPSELSGGMRKRVTLARTLVYEPDVLLADEPFGALDAQLKLLLARELLTIWERTRQTMVFVTHDISEAIALADRVIVFSRRPATVKLDCPVDLPRPRDLFSIRSERRYGELYEKLWLALADDIEAGEAV